MSKYIIWDKVSRVITPVGEVFTPQQWMDRYPMSKLDGIDLVISGESAVNGAFCNEYSSFVALYKEQGCDFTGCETRQDHLDKIEEFEKERNEAGQDYVSPEERIAAAEEGQLLVALSNQPE
jgi:hypothetical protein